MELENYMADMRKNLKYPSIRILINLTSGIKH